MQFLTKSVHGILVFVAYEYKNPSNMYVQLYRGLWPEHLPMSRSAKL